MRGEEKNHIQRLRKGHGWVIAHDEKALVVQDHFTEVMGRPPQRQSDINWESLQLQTHDLSELDVSFTAEEELKDAIQTNALR